MVVGCRRSSDVILLCLWHRLAVVAPSQPLAWELPYATGVALDKANVVHINGVLLSNQKIISFAGPIDYYT